MHHVLSSYQVSCSIDMGCGYEIRQIEQVLQPYLKNNRKIIKCNLKCLTQPGENYGSLMLSVDLTVKDEDGKENVINMVAKMCPPNDWIRKMFNTPVTFKKEEGIYKDVSLTLKSFADEYGLAHLTDFIPRCYGSRLSLNPDAEEVDDDAVLLLENLKVEGYEVRDRLEGFDLQTSKAIIKTLATFHAVALALKLRKPQVFQEKVRPNLKKMKGFTDVPEELRIKGENIFMDIIKKYDDLLPHLDDIRKYYRQGELVFQEGTESREPFATIGHSDCWVNNILVNGRNGHIKIKFVDYQIVDYGSPARDLIFFLYVSVQDNVLVENHDKLIRLYYNTFIHTLKSFKCDTEPFSFEAFEKELQYEAKKSQLFHCLSMTLPIFTVKGAVKPIEELTAEDMYNSQVSEKFEPKVVHVITGFIKNKWI